MINYQSLAKSEYYGVLKADFESELSEIMRPENVPVDSLISVKAHILLAKILKKKIEKLEKLRSGETVKGTTKLSEKERRELNSSE
jgi:hypothetical protein